MERLAGARSPRAHWRGPAYGHSPTHARPHFPHMAVLIGGCASISGLASRDLFFWSPDLALHSLFALPQAERQEEERFRQHMLAKFAEDDRLEQMNAQRRRLKVEEHKREVERLWAEKAALYAAQRAAEEAEAGRAAAEEAELAALVAGERERLIREHAAHLKGYLPKGVLANAAEMELLNEAAAALQLRS